MGKIKFGIEQEIILKNEKNQILDFSNSDYKQFKKIIDEFPYYKNDETYFHIKSTEKRPKRCYIEGFELHDKKGNVVKTIPKGIEIRTTPHKNIEDLLLEYKNSIDTIKNIAGKYKLHPVFISYHPFRNRFYLEENIWEHEKKLRTPFEFELATKSMFTFGLHINFSNKNWEMSTLSEIVNKLNYYLPFIIPFSFSSPFFRGREFKGFCYRNFKRAEYTKLVEIREKNNERYIEFKAFDVVKDEKLLKGLIFLIKGLILDKNLKNRAKKQNINLIKKSSLYGFKEKVIKDEAYKILKIISQTLGEEQKHIDILWEILETNKSPASLMKEKFKKSKDIITSIEI